MMKVKLRRRLKIRTAPTVTIKENPGGSKSVQITVASDRLDRDPETGNYVFTRSNFFMPYRFEVEPGVFLKVRVKLSIEAEPNRNEAAHIEAILLSRNESCVIPQ